MKLTLYQFNGTTYYLLLNGAALFDIYDRFGQDRSVLDPISGRDRASFEAVCWYLETLSAQGELYRRKQGYDHGPMLSAEELKVELYPLDVTEAKSAIKAAIAAGFLREEAEPPKEIDKGLLELEKKTDTN